MKNFKYAPLIEAVIAAVKDDEHMNVRAALTKAINDADLPDVIGMDARYANLKHKLFYIVRDAVMSAKDMHEYTTDTRKAIDLMVDYAIVRPAIPLAYWQVLAFKKSVEDKYPCPRMIQTWREVFETIDFWRGASRDKMMDTHVARTCMNLLGLNTTKPVVCAEFWQIFYATCRSLDINDTFRTPEVLVPRNDVIAHLLKVYNVKAEMLPAQDVDLTYLDSQWNIYAEAKIRNDVDDGRVRKAVISNYVLAYVDVKRPVLFAVDNMWRGIADLEQLRYCDGLLTPPAPMQSAEELDQKFDDIIRDNRAKWPQNLQVPFDTALNKHNLTEKLISDPILQPKATLEQLAEIGAQTERIDDEPKTHVFNISHKDLTPQDERLAGLVGNVKYNQRLGRASRGGIMVKDNGIIAGWGLAADWVDSVSIPAAKLDEIHGDKAMYEISNNPDGVTLGSEIKPIVLIDPVLLEAIKNEVAKQLSEYGIGRAEQHSKSNTVHNSSTVVDDNKHASTVVRASASSDGGTYVADADNTVDTTPESSHQSASANDVNDSADNSVSYTDGQDRLLNGRYDAVDRFFDECRGLIEVRRAKHTLELTRLDKVCKYMQVVRNLLKSE